ncbi:MAG: iron-sulfur cluster assembly scaffold protein [Candidatus Eiseniibacteriota bacterium]|jgi:NifU-like protein
MPWDYSDKTRELFMDAIQGKPGTHLGELEDPDGFGEHGSIACGDAMRFTFRVRRHPTDPTLDVITDVRYLTFGCTSAIASSEALCALIEGREYTPIQALGISNQDIVRFLDGLPAQKIHCSVMGAEALEAAVFNWAQRRGVDLAELGIELPSREEQEGRVVCNCFTLTEPYLRRKIQELGLRTIPEVTGALKAGGACMTCHHAPGGLQDLLDAIWGRRDTTVKTDAIPPDPREIAGDGDLSPYQLAKRIETTIDAYVRPMLEGDGGDIELVDIKDHTIYARLTGACAGCAGASMTLKMMIEQTLKERVDQRVRVIAV